MPRSERLSIRRLEQQRRDLQPRLSRKPQSGCTTDTELLRYRAKRISSSSHRYRLGAVEDFLWAADVLPHRPRDL